MPYKQPKIFSIISHPISKGDPKKGGKRSYELRFKEILNEVRPNVLPSEGSYEEQLLRGGLIRRKVLTDEIYIY